VRGAGDAGTAWCRGFHTASQNKHRAAVYQMTDERERCRTSGQHVECGSLGEAACRPATDEGESGSVNSVAALHERLAQAEAKAAENWDLYLRARAELENFQKRTARDLAFNIRCGIRDLVLDILVVVDDLERALGCEHDQASMREGVEIITRKLLDVLARHGVKPIEAVGQPFDPRLHDAVSGREDETVAVHTVVQELRRGYTFEEDVLRPTLAVVAIPKHEEGQ
jgi:molecular chaperone GrpE